MMRFLIAVSALALALAAAEDPSVSDQQEQAFADVLDASAVGDESEVDAERAARRAQCLTRGFEVEALDCGLCEQLAAFLESGVAGSSAVEQGKSDVELKEVSQVASECRECCTDFGAGAALGVGATRHQFARVELEVCTCKFQRYPKVADFVNNRAAAHPRLEVKYVNARHPHLLFYDAEGVKQEEVSIGNWDEDTISEFIVAKLTPDGGSEEGEVAEQEKEAEQEQAGQEQESEQEQAEESEEVKEDGHTASDEL